MRLGILLALWMRTGRGAIRGRTHEHGHGHGVGMERPRDDGPGQAKCPNTPSFGDPAGADPLRGAAGRAHIDDAFFADGWNAHDVNVLMSFMSDDCVFEGAAGPDACGTRYAGRERVCEAFDRVFKTFPDATFGDARHFVAGWSTAAISSRSRTARSR